MSIAGVDDDVAGPLVRAVSAPGAAAAPDEAAERFARAAWSHLAEPGDALSGLLVQVFGAPGALGAVQGPGERGSGEQVAARTGSRSNQIQEDERSNRIGGSKVRGKGGG